MHARLKYAALSLGLLLAAGKLGAQTDSVSSQKPIPVPRQEFLLMDAADLASCYDFSAALSKYREALVLCRDSLRRVEIEDRITRCTNGINMAEYCTRPRVVTRRRFALKDFFLYYPLPDGGWHPTPNALDSLGGRFAAAVYAPDGAKSVFWSAPDSLGVRDIFCREAGDSVSRRVGVSSAEDDIYPMVSGGRLYFSSRGLYGVGGYDIYVCDPGGDGSWGAPRNLGFPYSSPADDFLFLNTPDGRYSIFASNRGCPADSVNVYVLETEVMPVGSPVDGVAALRELCELNPADDLKKVDNQDVMSGNGEGDGSLALYLAQVAGVRAIRDSLNACDRVLAELRLSYAEADEAGREELSGRILSMEKMLPALQERLARAGRDLQKTEMDFLMNGVVIDFRKAEAEADKEIVGAENAYTFSRHKPGSGNF